MKKKLTEWIARRIPSGHWLPLSVVASVTLIVISGLALYAWVTVVTHRELARRDTTADPPQSNAGEAQPNQIPESPQDDVADVATDSEPMPTDATEERMVPEWMLRLLLDELKQSDERSDRRLARRDKQIDSLTDRLATFQSVMNSQQQQIVRIQAEQLQRAWATVEKLENEVLGRPIRSTGIPIIERNGPEAGQHTRTGDANVFGIPRQPAQKVDDPFAVDKPVTGNSPRVTPRVRKPRKGYLNVSPKRSGVGTGIPAGSAASRIKNRNIRHDAAVKFGQKYTQRSATSRLLGELERGNR